MSANSVSRYLDSVHLSEVTPWSMGGTRKCAGTEKERDMLTFELREARCVR